MDRVASLQPIVALAEHSATIWRHVRGEAFAGTATFETANTVYRFVDGVFAGRMDRREPAKTPAWDTSPSLAGVELIGFFANEGGFWSFSPKWRAGSLAVFVTRAKTFTLTSPTRAYRMARPSGPVRAAPEQSDVFDRPRSRPVAVRRPAPLSMTRIQAIPAVAR